MVLAEKNSENARNGRRSMGPSPNGHLQADSTSEDESGVPIDKIRVGRDYQAVCPELQPVNERKPELLADRALLVWSPTEAIGETKLEDYIVLAKDKYGYNGEQALGMLFWHKHDLDRAMLDLANFTPFPDEWSVEDKVLFEQAFQFHGKSFHRIRQMLPDKSIASLVKYYYSWKKTRSRTSLMDKQARKLNAPKEDGVPSEGGSENGSNEESDHEDKIQQNKQGISSLKRKHSDSTDDLRPDGPHGGRFSSRWSNEELLLAVQAVRKYGKDFKSIAEAVGTKTEFHVRAFFINYRKRYNLETILKEYEMENGPFTDEATPATSFSNVDSQQDNDVICISPTPVPAPSQQDKKKETKNGKMSQTGK